MQECPQCKSPRVLRSRARGRFEELRKKFTHSRPYRCHACGWRAWRSPHDELNAHVDGPVQGKSREALDLEAVDRTWNEIASDPALPQKS